MSETGREFVEIKPGAGVFVTLSFVNQDGLRWTEQGVVHRAPEWSGPTVGHDGHGNLKPTLRL